MQPAIWGPIIWPAWNWPADMPMPGPIGSVGASPRFWAQPSPKKFTTATTLPGARHTAVRIFGWSARAPHRLSPQRGFVGGTMGEISVILEGVENESAAES